ncbi:MAG TPA: amidohydrolase family protein [Fimbriimonadaceae bacterium]|jgi:N-acetylglucosamine-6-phosphate deacetylase
MKYQAIGPSGFGTYEVEWVSGSPVFTESSGSADGILAPGLVDIHIHGAFGIDFMSATAAEMVQLASRLRELGYEAFLPTTITATPSDIASALSNLPEHEMMWGFHLEGPFISELHPGAQPVSSITTPGSEWDSILDDPRLRVITLAPERVGVLPLISRLSSRGVAVSMGHSDATYEQAMAGFKAGATHVTHTFNAMRGFHHREAGLAGFAMIENGVYAELIYDRIHVSEPSASLLVRSKPVDKLVAVSDSSRATGLPSGQHITMWGHDCVTTPGQVRLASNGALAGSAITLKDAFQNLAADFGVETAIRACCLSPRLSIGETREPKVWLEFSNGLELREVKH